MHTFAVLTKTGSRHVTEVDVVVALVLFFVGVTTIAPHALVLHTELIVTTVFVNEALGALTLTTNTDTLVQFKAIVAAVTLFACRILVHTLTTGGSVASSRYISSSNEIMTEEFRLLWAAAVAGLTLVVPANFVVVTLAITQALSALALSIYTNAVVQLEAVAVACTLVACRILEHTFATVSSEAVSSNISHPNQIVTEELITIRVTAVAWNTLVALTYFVIGTMIITEALSALALTVDAYSFVQLVAIVVVVALPTL